MKKLRKDDKLALALIVVVCVLISFSLFYERDRDLICSRPITENIIIPFGETESLEVDLDKWDLQIIQNEVISINSNELIPLARGQVNLTAVRKDLSNCSFTSVVSVVNFREDAQSGNGRAGI